MTVYTVVGVSSWHEAYTSLWPPWGWVCVTSWSRTMDLFAFKAKGITTVYCTLGNYWYLLTVQVKKQQQVALLGEFLQHFLSPYFVFLLNTVQYQNLSNPNLSHWIFSTSNSLSESPHSYSLQLQEMSQHKDLQDHKVLYNTPLWKPFPPPCVFKDNTLRKYYHHHFFFRAGYL